MTPQNLVTRPPGLSAEEAPELYLDLLKKTLTRCILRETWRPASPRNGSLRYWLHLPVRHLLKRSNLEMVRRIPLNSEARAEGRDWPVDGETMIGLKRLDNLQFCIRDVLEREVPGDLIETGVWRGGAVIFMRATLKAYGDRDRVVWVADSFQGLPKAGSSHADDVSDKLWREGFLRVPLREVRENFARYGLLDDRVRFLPGWFSDTLPAAPVRQLSVLRLDGDLYESTMTALSALYPKLSVGGYVIVDDYHAVHGCRRAVDDFRRENGIDDEMNQVDWGSVFWRRSS